MHTRPGWEAKTILEIDVPVNLFRASFMTPKLTVVEVDMMNQDVVIWVLWLLLKISCQHKMAMYLVIIPSDWLTNLRTIRDNRTERRFEEKLKNEVMNRSGCPIRGRWDLRFAD